MRTVRDFITPLVVTGAPSPAQSPAIGVYRPFFNYDRGHRQ